MEERVIDATNFLPQSRPRLFLIAVHHSAPIIEHSVLPEPQAIWHNKALINAYHNLPNELRHHWIWWNLPNVSHARKDLGEILDTEVDDAVWHSHDETMKLLNMMSSQNLAKVRQAQSMQTLQVGTIYRRTRLYEGQKMQRAEVRFDGISGCLRTPAGGSSRQTVLIFLSDRQMQTNLLFGLYAKTLDLILSIMPGQVFILV